MKATDWRWPDLLLLLLIFIPRLLQPVRFLTADEILFLEHSRAFAGGIINGDWGQTAGIGYPGVTVAWWSGLPVRLAGTELGAYGAGQVTTALATGLLLVIFYALARRLISRRAAWPGTLLLALDPYSLAYSRLFHIAGPLALLMSLAALSYLLWLRENKPGWLLLTALWSGLALLTKSTALLLGPMLVVMLLVWGLIARPRWARQIAGLIATGGGAMLIFWLLWPAMWTAPGSTLALTLGKLFTDQAAGTGNLGMFWRGRFVQDPGPLFYPVVFLLKATPWLLAGLALSLWGGVRRWRFLGKKRLRNDMGESIFRGVVLSQWDDTEDENPATLPPSVPPARGEANPSPKRGEAGRGAIFRGDSASEPPVGLALWGFALAYLLLMTLASKKSVRYLLPTFPSLYLLAGLGLARLRLELSRPLRYALPGGLLLFSLFYHPYYFTYYNPLLLGWRWAPRTVLVGWGEGLDRAARHLNQRPPAKVAAWYDWVFAPFYRGSVTEVVPPENLITADYSVLYLNQVQRNIPDPNLVRYFRELRQPEHTVRLAGIEYAWLYHSPLLAAPPQPAYPLGGQFGEEARLLGYDLHRSGGPLVVTLYWQPLRDSPGERFIYLRLVDEPGRIWAGVDGPPLLGFWPTARWQAGTFIEDAHALPAPPGTPPGPYRLEVGLYDPESGRVLPASGQPVGAGGGLLLGRVEIPWQGQPGTAEDLPHRAETRLIPAVELVGYDAPPATATTGELMTLRLAWRDARARWSLSAPAADLRLMFTWLGPETVHHMETFPLPFEAWGRGAMLRSQHTLIVPPTLPAGRCELRLRLHNGVEAIGRPFSLGEVEITVPPRRFDLPAEARPPTGPAQLGGGIRLAGYAFDEGNQLRLYWQTDRLLSTRYRSFAQLLDQQPVAQSDHFPERSTTGWLPGEIITDTHRLALPSGGPYRLIAGLYDPRSGERLPLRDGSGNAIFIAEVSGP